MGNQSSADLNRSRKGIPPPQHRNGHLNNSHTNGVVPASPVVVRPKNIFVQANPDGSLGFSFSSARKVVHFVNLVDPGSLAERAGLQLGHQIVAINNVVVTELEHHEVVQVLKDCPRNRPVALKVVPPTDRIFRYLKRSALAPLTEHSKVSGRSQITSAEAQRQFCAIIVHPEQGKYLATVQQNVGHEALYSDIPVGMSYVDAITLAIQRGIGVTSPDVVGILRFDCTPERIRVVALVHIHDDILPALPSTSPFISCVWLSLSELIALDKDLGKAPWPQGRIGLHSTTLIYWGKQLEGKQVHVAPLSLLEGSTAVPHSSHNASYSTQHQVQRQEAPTAEPQMREHQARERINSVVIAIPPPPPPVESENGKPQKARKKLAPAPAHAPAHAHAPIQFPEPTEVVEPQKVRDITLYASQCDEVADSVENTRMRTVDLAIPQGNTFPTLGLDLATGEEFETCSEVIIGDVVTGSPAEKASFFEVGDRLVKVNGQWIVSVQHASETLATLQHMAHVDVTISRGEMLPAPRAFASMSDADLVAALLDATGSRVSLESESWTRESIIDALGKRVDPDLPVEAASTLQHEDGDGDDDGARAEEEAATKGEVSFSSSNSEAKVEEAQEKEEAEDEPVAEVEVEVEDDSGSLSFVAPPPAYSTPNDSSKDVDNSAAPVLTLVEGSSTEAATSTSDEAAETTAQTVQPDDAVQETPSDEQDQASSAKSALRKPGQGSRGVSVRFNMDAVTHHETFSKIEYHRPLDPGRGFRDLRSLFNFNNERMEREQALEADQYMESRRVYGHYVQKKKSQRNFGFRVKPIPKDLSQPYLFLEGVEITKIEPKGAVGKHGQIKEGDRLLKINGQMVLNHQHAEYLLYELLRGAQALDLTITRDEPLPPGPDLTKLSDQELVDLAFEHGGFRVAVSPQHNSREEVMLMVRKRFASTGDENKSALANHDADEDEEC